MAVGTPSRCSRVGEHFYFPLLPHLILTSKSPSPYRKIWQLPSQHDKEISSGDARTVVFFFCPDNFCRIKIFLYNICISWPMERGGERERGREEINKKHKNV